MHQSKQYKLSKDRACVLAMKVKKKKWVGFRLITFIEFIWRRNNSFGDAVAVCVCVELNNNVVNCWLSLNFWK